MAIEKNREQKRAWYFRRTYGLTLEDVAAMFHKQDGRCAICGAFLDLSNMYSYAIDHCHETGQIRGMLCKLCNASLGGFRDSQVLLKKAGDYLKKYQT